MITSEKDWPRYKATCNCGEELEFISNKPAGNVVAAICSCFDIFYGEIRDGGKYRYKPRAKTEALRSSILYTFNRWRMRMSVRQVYYQIVINGDVEKTDNGYRRVQRQLLLMRQEGILPHSLIVDSSRSYYKSESYNSLKEATDRLLRRYKVDTWKNTNAYVEIWLEKEGLAGIFREVTDEFDVPLYPTKGFTSETFVYEAAVYIMSQSKPAFIYIFSDHDPSGEELSDTIIKKMKAFGVDAYFERIALTTQQIEYYNLPTRYTKKTTHKKGFKGPSTELDALPPDVLKELIRNCILKHINPHDIENIKMETAVHKETLSNILVQIQ